MELSTKPTHTTDLHRGLEGTSTIASRCSGGQHQDLQDPRGCPSPFKNNLHHQQANILQPQQQSIHTATATQYQPSLNQISSSSYGRGPNFPPKSNFQTGTSTNNAINSTGSLTRRLAPPSSNRRDANDNPNSDSTIDYEVRGILNKITPEKFDKLSQELLNLGLESQDVLKRVLLLILDKALDDYKYCCMYAKLCKVINENLSDYYKQTNQKNIFKILLLLKCKGGFENRRKKFESFENKNEPLSIDDEERRAIAKQKMLGNIKFICELGKQQLLPKNILHECIRQLLSKKKNQNYKDKTQDLECLCEIMKNIGHLLEEDEEAVCLMDQYFGQIEKYSKNPEISSRIKFMLLDVIDLRKDNWIPRQRESLHRSVADVKVEKDHNSELISQYGTLFPMGLNRHPSPFMNNQRPDDVFSHVPMGPMYLGTGPGAINDMNFSLNSNQRGPGGRNYPNYQNKGQQSSYLGMGSGGGNHYQHQNNSMMRQDKNRGDNQQTSQQNQNYRQQQNYQQSQGQPSNQNQVSNGLSRGAGPATNLGSDLPSNLPPRFQKQIKYNNPPQNNLPQFQSFGSRGNNQQQNDGDNRNNRVQNNNFGNNNRFNDRNNFRGPNVPFMNNVKPANTFNKFINPGRNLNGGKDSLFKVVNDLDRMGLSDDSKDGQNADNKSGGQKNEVNVFLEIEKLLLEYYDNEKSEKLIEFLKNTAVNFDEILLSIMRICISKNEKERELTHKLINKLKLDSVVSDAAFISALKSLFAKINELEVETPRARSYVAAYVANAIVESVVSLKEIGDLLDGGAYYPLFPLILQNLHKAKSQEWLFDMFTDSKINLMQMVPEPDRNKERMADILEDRNLTFLYPMLRIESDITRQITSDCSPTSLYRWLKENVNTTLQSSPEFISVVFSTLLKHIIAKYSNADNPSVFTNQLFAQQDAELKKYSQVLQKFLTGKHNLQLIVLYSLQTYCHDHDFPKGLIEKWFDMLYEHEIVEEEVFFKWREDINDEYPGKGKSLFQVNKWLTWLAEEEEEE